MKVDKIVVSNFLAFYNFKGTKEFHTDIETVSVDTKEPFEIDFSKGINVLIGENATGKTTLLKMIYAATQWSNTKTDPNKTKRITDFFSFGENSNELLKSYGTDDPACFYELHCEGKKFEWSLTHNGFFNYGNWLGTDIESVFIPAKDMISHSNGFLALNNKYRLPFDGTLVDIIVNAQLPELREYPEYFGNILKILEASIDGKVVFEKDKFYVVKHNGQKLPYEYESDGFKKLGLLYRLLSNGSIRKDSILLWDEPEANINPELFPVLVDILFELEKQGIQIFITTHNYVFAKYFDLKKKEQPISFYSLYKEDGIIHAERADKFSDIKNNSIMSSFEKMLDEVYDQR